MLEVVGNLFGGGYRYSFVGLRGIRGVIMGIRVRLVSGIVVILLDA